jgi:membrane protein DedA with SNARE-associated domain
MSNILPFLLSFLLLYKYWTIFVLVFIAAVIVPIPVNTLLLAAGAFASQGYFSFSISIVVAVLANVLGDCFDFFLARRYNRQILHLMHIRVPTYFARLEAFVQKYPGSAIFLTRFVGTIEPIVSLLCGFIGIGFMTFLLYDFLGNLVSNGIVLGAGYFLGIHWQDFSGLFSTTDYILVGLIIVAVLCIVMWRKKRNHAVLSRK